MLFAQFLKKFSILEGRALNTLKLFQMKDFSLPLDSCLHYIDMESTELGIRGGHSLLANFGKDIRVFHEHNLDIIKGRARKQKVSFNKMESTYFKQQTRVRRARDLGKALDSRRNLVVYDYSLLTHGVDYSDNVFTPYNEWFNIRSAINKGLTLTAKERESFVVVKMPKVLPELADFKIATEELTSNHIQKWHNYETLELRDLWLAIDGLGLYGKLDKEVVNSTTIILTGFGFVTALPLRYLILTEESKVSSESQKNHLYDVFEKFAEQYSLATSAELAEAEAITIESSGSVSTKIQTTVLELQKHGLLTSKEKERILTLAKETDNIPNPFGEGTLTETVKVKAEDTVVEKPVPNSVKKIVDKEYLDSTVSNYDKGYRDKLMKKDTANMVLKLKDAGIIVRDFQTEEVNNALDSYTDYTIKLQPITGRASTLKFQIPKPDNEGRFKYGGNKYTFDIQRVDMPIRKSGPGRVALTSYYGKVFIDRSELAVDNYGRWLLKHITEAGLDSSSRNVTNIRYGDVPKIDDPVSIAYAEIASRLTGFNSGRFAFTFDYHNREKVFGKDTLKKYEVGGRVCCANNSSGDVVVIDKANVLYVFAKGSKEETYLGKIEDYVLPEKTPAPQNIAVMSVFGKKVPVGVALAYLMGLENLLKYLKVKYRTLATGSRDPVQSWELPIKFKDEMLLIDGRDPKISMIFGGFRKISKIIHSLRMDQADQKEGYGPLMAPLKASTYHLSELELMDEMFIDPITEEILASKDQPTEFKDLLIYAVELLTDNRYPDETDPEFMRLRGLERFSGMLYFRIIEALRAYKNNPYKKTAIVSMPPTAVIKDIQCDQTTMIASTLNPIGSLKQEETVSLGGAGGRSAETLMKRSRIYHKNDLGLISEGTPDSAKVGIRAILSPNANLTNLRGISKRYDPKQSSNAVLSTTGLLLPGTNHDDAKRANLSQVQMSALVHAKGYQSLPLRTGYEQVIASRSDNSYAHTVSIDGTVEKITKDTLFIKGKDGKVEGVKLGTIHGGQGGLTIPHEIITDLEVGSKVSAGDIVAWNKDYFERDWINPRNATFKIGALANVAFMEGNGTLEDSSLISQELAKKLTSSISKHKVIVVDETDHVLNLVKVGDEIDIDTPLCLIQDGTIDPETLTDEVVSSLMRFSDRAPKAKFKGKITEIKCLYRGEKSQMSETVLSIVEASDKLRKKAITEHGSDDAPTGKVDRDTYVSGNKLEAGQVAIEIFIDSDLGVGVGDKGVLASQLKTVFGGVMSGVNETEAGDSIDMIFGWRSVMDRIVLSAEIMGITNAVLMEISRQAAEKYFEE